MRLIAGGSTLLEGMAMFWKASEAPTSTLATGVTPWERFCAVVRPSQGQAGGIDITYYGTKGERSRVGGRRRSTVEYAPSKRGKGKLL